MTMLDRPRRGRRVRELSNAAAKEDASSCRQGLLCRERVKGGGGADLKTPPI